MLSCGWKSSRATGWMAKAAGRHSIFLCGWTMPHARACDCSRQPTKVAESEPGSACLFFGNAVAQPTSAKADFASRIYARASYITHPSRIEHGVIPAHAQLICRSCWGIGLGARSRLPIDSIKQDCGRSISTSLLGSERATGGKQCHASFWNLSHAQICRGFGP